MSTSYYLIDKASLQRKKQHYKQVAELIENIEQLTKKLTVADAQDVEDKLIEFRNNLEWLIEAHEQGICKTGYKRVSWHMRKEELEEQYKIGHYVIQDEYQREYTLEEFMRKVEG